MSLYSRISRCPQCPALPASPVKAVDAAVAAATGPAAKETEKKPIPQKPREATQLEKEIKDNEIKLRLLKPRSLELLEADEAAAAANA